MIREPFDVLVCDLDGVLYRGDEPISGAADAVGSLRDAGIRILFCTNNSRYTVADYTAKLSGFGIDVGDDLLTSALVTADVLAGRGMTGKTAIVVGGAGIKEALGSACIAVKDDPSVTRADVVVVGWDPAFDYDAMKRASAAVRHGAALVATNDDAAFPAPGGELWPGAGAIVAAIEVASGSRAEVMGKPHAPMLDALERRAGPGARIAAVGDRPETDLAGAAARGWSTILVLSGVTAADRAGALEDPPDLVVDSIAELAAALDG